MDCTYAVTDILVDFKKGMGRSRISILVCFNLYKFLYYFVTRFYVIGIIIVNIVIYYGSGYAYDDSYCKFVYAQCTRVTFGGEAVSGFVL